jgi:cytochrome P450
LTALLQAHHRDDRLSLAELTNLVVALLVGGKGSPSVFLTSAVYVLLTKPTQLDLLRREPDRIPAAVEELLRYIPIGVAGGFVRVSLEDVDVDGVLVRAGEAVVPAMISANHDAAIFAEPAVLDVTRQNNPHLGFGHGAHHCIGAPLARLQAQVALATLLRRFPDLRLADDAESYWKEGVVVRGLNRLDVRW